MHISQNTNGNIVIDINDERLLQSRKQRNLTVICQQGRSDTMNIKYWQVSESFPTPFFEAVPPARERDETVIREILKDKIQLLNFLHTLTATSNST